MTNVRSIDVPRSAATTIDALAVDAALWRAHRRLGAAWLHTFRGAMNAISLSARLVASKRGADGDTPMTVIREQLQELDAGLSRLLETSADQRDACDAAAVMERLQLLLTPLARQRGRQIYHSLSANPVELEWM